MTIIDPTAVITDPTQLAKMQDVLDTASLVDSEAIVDHDLLTDAASWGTWFNCQFPTDEGDMRLRLIVAAARGDLIALQKELTWQIEQLLGTSPSATASAQQLPTNPMSTFMNTGTQQPAATQAPAQQATTQAAPVVQHTQATKGSNRKPSAGRR